MKYIRTKDDKICLLHEDLFTKGVWWVGTKEEVLQFSCIPSDLGKVAETIEELCDEFVAVGVPFKTFVIEKSLYEGQGLTLREYIHYLYCQYTNIVVYGAIWTEWGLKYVAKMNEEGELELL